MRVVFQVVLRFEFADEILNCVHSNERCAAVIPYVAVYCGWMKKLSCETVCDRQDGS